MILGALAAMAQTKVKRPLAAKRQPRMLNEPFKLKKI